MIVSDLGIVILDKEEQFWKADIPITWSDESASNVRVDKLEQS